MSWQSLGQGVGQENELFWALTPSEASGTLWVRIPGSPDHQSIFLGIGDASSNPPDRLEERFLALQPFGQILRFEIPPALTSPFLAIRFEQIPPLEFIPTMTFIKEKDAFVPVVQSLGNTTGLVAGTMRTLFGYGENYVAISTGWLGEEREENVQVSPPIASPSSLPPGIEDLPFLDWSALSGASSVPATTVKRIYRVVLTNVDEDQAATIHVRYEDELITGDVVTLTLQPGERHTFSIGKTNEQIGRVKLKGYQETDAKLSASVYWRWLVKNSQP